MPDNALTAPPIMPPTKHSSLTNWGGYYTISFIVVGCKMSDAVAALPKGLTLNKTYAKPGGGSEMLYPILVSVGNIEDAHLRAGSFLGINYYEIFSAIPGVELNQGEGPLGPFIYPYRGYLNRLLPTVLGRVSGLRKYWDRVRIATTSSTTSSPPYSTDLFTVQSLFAGQPILDGEFEFGQSIGLSYINLRVETLQQLLPPNLVAMGLFGHPVRTKFDFKFEHGLAWEITRAKVNIRVPDIIPGMNQPVTITYPPTGDASSIVWPDCGFAPVRAFVPWQLKSDKGNALAAASLMPAIPAGGSQGNSDSAGGSGSSPTPDSAAPPTVPLK